MNLKKLFVIGIALTAINMNAYAAVKIQHWQTPAGAEVYFVENHDLPIVDVSVNFSAGSARDTAEKSGVAGITRYLMTLGADGMTDEVIANKMADIGAILGGEFDADRASFKLRTLSSAREKAATSVVQAFEVGHSYWLTLFCFVERKFNDASCARRSGAVRCYSQ